jgi:hypothetical protein
LEAPPQVDENVKNDQEKKTSEVETASKKDAQKDKSTDRATKKSKKAKKN